MQAQDTITKSLMGNNNTLQHCHIDLANIDKKLLFGGSPVGDMFQRNIYEIFIELLNISSIADDILIEGLIVGRCINTTRVQTMVEKYAECCRYAQNKTLCLIKTNVISDALAFHFWRNYFQASRKPHPRKLKAITDMPLPKASNELQAFQGVLGYCSKLLPATGAVCESLS